MSRSLKTLIVLFKAYHNTVDHVKLSLKDTGFSLNEFAAMEALYVKGSLTTAELVSYVLVPNSSMTYVLDTLEKREYIARTKDNADRRIQKIQLTNTGIDVFECLYEKHVNTMRTVFDVLTPEEEQQLQTLLKKLGMHAVECK